MKKIKDASENIVVFIEKDNKITEFVASINRIGYTNPKTDLLPVILFAYEVDPQEKFYELLSKIDSSWVNSIKPQLLENGINI